MSRLPRPPKSLLPIPALLLTFALVGLVFGLSSSPQRDEADAEGAGAVLAAEDKAPCEVPQKAAAPKEEPNDPLFARQRALRETGVPEAWPAGGGEGVRVAVIDSGVDTAHPDLAGKVVAARDFSGAGPATQDPTGHGTAVAGILAAEADDGEGIAGVCPECELVVARVDAYGAAGDNGTIQLARAIQWSSNQGARVINVSLGTSTPSPQLARAVERVSGDGALVVAAAGDPGSGFPLYPAAYPQAVSVSAGVGDEDAWSNPGDISASGDGVLSPLPGGGHGAFSGTSAATPQVSGAAALLVGGGLSTAEARERLLSAARDVQGTVTPSLDVASAVRASESGGCPGDDEGTRGGR